MDNLEHITGIQDQIDEEVIVRVEVNRQVELFRRVIQVIVDHPNSPEKQDIIDECERDINMKYETKQISMQHRLMLLQTLYGQS